MLNACLLSNHFYSEIKVFYYLTLLPAFLTSFRKIIPPHSQQRPAEMGILSAKSNKTGRNSRGLFWVVKWWKILKLTWFPYSTSQCSAIYLPWRLNLPALTKHASIFLSYAYRWQMICLVYNVTSLEEGMATHSSVLAWEIPWTEEPGGLQFMALQSQTRHD